MHGKLEKIYFPIPTLMNYLSEESKSTFLEKVNRESINDKLIGLLDEVEGFKLEMEYYKNLQKFGFRFNNAIIHYLRILGLVFTLIINILLLNN